MKISETRIIAFVILAIFNINPLESQHISIDTSKLDIQARSYMIENYLGNESIYLQGGSITLKDVEFLNGTIEYDIYLKEEQAFPGVYFRIQNEEFNAEQFYIRPHLSGKPDANQVAPIVNGISPWQLCFGPKYSFPYEYKYDDWTHVKILVNGKKAQVFLDHSTTPNLSWELFHPIQKGGISIQGGNRSGMHIANIKINHEAPEISNFKPIERQAIDGLVQQWDISDKFKEELLQDPENLNQLIEERTWEGSIKNEEGTAANISRIHNLRNGKPGNTVFARIEIYSDEAQLKLFEFGYSDRVLAILNGDPVYKGTNRWRSRDYRYLGTIGLFDSIFLDLKKGKNTLLMAVSEDFGGWLITGKFGNTKGLDINGGLEN